MHIMVELTISEEEIHTMTGLPLSQTFGHDADEFPANADQVSEGFEARRHLTDLCYLVEKTFHSTSMFDSVISRTFCINFSIEIRFCFTNANPSDNLN